jgi:hypothetical protein
MEKGKEKENPEGISGNGERKQIHLDWGIAVLQ